MVTSQPQVVFIHLPKTGGFALHAALVRALPPESVLRIGDEAERAAFLAMTPDQVAGCALVSGHVTVNEALERARPDARFVTLLRDPVARLVSAFNYMATWPDHPLHAEFRDRGFAEFIRDSAEALAGEACRQLTGAASAKEAIPILEGCYALVGTSARVNDVSATLHRWLGVVPGRVERENVTAGQGRINLDSATCELLLAVTREDRALFEHVAGRHGGLMKHPGVPA
ncbi:sulfotransferase family 2 domain-containing protein [Roseomonas stagni]|uniref:Sulfotransferase family 2 domain-containing protein n=1 Tax=Falsiroseomonas algicola TaxID=2716930 RepID=A0A6M1LIY9_9PROT|nr:sulfotransferase family 2 domain-containing protein [Falsiroseomonas algicola]NGM20230.1 sulfotransferase family 2 domain-containing protein [Falsiroseomonas algicola]